ncbi:MAG: hypothetical protein HOC27_04640 [Phycisphaerae bacterium]|nr:hypothetical protein [Phycisphaerae bacterium]
MNWINTNILLLCMTASPVAASSTQLLTFDWEDINTREVVRWEGDTAIVQHGSTMQNLSCKIKLDTKDIEAAIESYGIPKSWTSITYTDKADLQKQQKAIQQKASRHGIKMDDNMDKYIVDYKWVINQSTRKLRDVAKTIRSEARRNGYRSRRELVGAFASFVQSLDYKIPPDRRQNEDGEEILTVGAMVPLDVLSKQWGDCDSKSMLFASLVQSIDLVDVVFIVMKEHLFAAVDLRPEKDDQSILHNRDDWVLIELTDAWPIGRVPEKHIDSITKNKFDIFDLN